jgi:hypothetical protein
VLISHASLGTLSHKGCGSLFGSVLPRTGPTATAAQCTQHLRWLCCTIAPYHLVCSRSSCSQIAVGITFACCVPFHASQIFHHVCMCIGHTQPQGLRNLFVSPASNNFHSHCCFVYPEYYYATWQVCAPAFWVHKASVAVEIV